MTRLPALLQRRPGCAPTDRPMALSRPPRSTILAGFAAWISKEVFRLSHTNNDWRLGYE